MFGKNNERLEDLEDSILFLENDIRLIKKVTREDSDTILNVLREVSLDLDKTKKHLRALYSYLNLDYVVETTEGVVKKDGKKGKK